MNVKKINALHIQSIIDHHFSDVLDYDKVFGFLLGFAQLDETVKTNTKILNKNLSKLIYEKLLIDIKYIASKDPSINNVNQLLSSKTITLTATMYYRTTNFFYYSDLAKNKTHMQAKCREVMEYVLSITSIDIHPAAKIDEEFFIDHGANLVIGETVVIGKRCTLFNNVILGSKNVITAQKKSKRHPTLLDDVVVCAGAKILGDITIGNNVFVSPSAVVLEDIEDNHKVIITNQLQLTKNSTRAILPSQKLVVYGVVPKFKNTFVIMGECFYNPTVLIKLKNNKELDYTVSYWDKNKVIVKIKNTTPLTDESLEGVKMIILSNNNKVVLLHSVGLITTLKTLID